MRLRKLHLVNFKNYAEGASGVPGKPYHCFWGKNGSGNQSAGGHTLFMFHQAAVPDDAATVRHGRQAFAWSGLFEKEGKMGGRLQLLRRQKKMSENGTGTTRFSEHIGKYPLVWVAPK